MTKRTMRKYLKKPASRRDPKKKAVSTNWIYLQKTALERAQANGLPEEDPRFRLLRSIQGDPERVLRRLSILSPVDIDREFGPKPE